jgi:hypothetical protein
MSLYPISAFLQELSVYPPAIIDRAKTFPKLAFLV